jgi:hypothetical protein
LKRRSQRASPAALFLATRSRPTSSLPSSTLVTFIGSLLPQPNRTRGKPCSRMCSPYEVRCARPPTSLLWSQLFPVPGPINRRRYVRSGASVLLRTPLRAYPHRARALGRFWYTPRQPGHRGRYPWVQPLDGSERRNSPGAGTGRVRGAAGRLIEGSSTSPIFSAGRNQTL